MPLQMTPPRPLAGVRRAFFLSASLAAGAHATAFNVNTTNMNLINDGNCGFREALAAINGGNAMWGCPAPDNTVETIYLPAGTYTSPVSLDATRSVNIICLGPGACNLDAGNFSGPLLHLSGNLEPNVSIQRINFRQPAGNANSITGIAAEAGSVNMEDASIQGFRLNGLVLAAGVNHNVMRTAFSNNSSDAVFVGTGAALNISFSTLTGSTQSGIVTGANGTVYSQSNTISNSGLAGVSLSQGSVFTDEGSTLYNNGGAGIDGIGNINLTRTIVRKNRNGGVRVEGGFGEIAICTIDSNTTSGSGGGLAILVPGFANVRYTTISNNKATVNGGGVYMTAGGNFTHCTISNDTATRGGGVYHVPSGQAGSAYVEMSHTTVAYNRATVSGGGVYALQGSSPTRSFQSIVAKNTAGSAKPDVSGPVNSYNTLYGDSTGFTGIHNDDYFNPNPLLGPLMDNAGPNRVKTHALLKGSPAIDKHYTETAIDGLDGRGFPRPLPGLWDLGAYEVVPYETELLTVIGKSSDQYDYEPAAALSNGMGNVLWADAANDFVTYAVAIPEPGNYAITVRDKAGPNRGIYELATSPGTTSFTAIGSLDLYKASAQYLVLPALTFNFTSAGIKHFRFRVTGKNAASTGYLGFFDYIKISKQ